MYFVQLRIILGLVVSGASMIAIEEKYGSTSDTAPV